MAHEIGINKYRGPMDAVKELTRFLDTLEEDSVKVQILEIYLEDNPKIYTELMEVIALDKSLANAAAAYANAAAAYANAAAAYANAAANAKREELNTKLTEMVEEYLKKGGNV